MKISLLIIIIVICLTASANVCVAQAPYTNWLNYTNNNTVNCIADDGHDLWIGTTGGLIRQNDATFERTYYLKTNSPLPDNNVTAMTVDAFGNKWFGTEFGFLVKFDDTKWQVCNSFYYNGNGDRILALVSEKTGVIWIAMKEKGLGRFENGNWTRYDADNSDFKPGWIISLAIDNKNNKWIGTDEGLYKFDDKTWSYYDENNSGMPYRGAAIAFDKKGAMWVGTWDGLAKYEDSVWTVYNHKNSKIPSDEINTIAIDSNGNIWVAPDNGDLVKFDGKNWKIYDNSKFGIQYFSISTLTFDKNGNLWLGDKGYDIYNDYNGDNGCGLIMFDGVYFTSMNISNSGLLNNDITDIKIDSRGNKWILCDGTSGIIKFDGNNWILYNETNSPLPNDGMRNFEADKKGNVWFATKIGLIKYDGDNWIKIDTLNFAFKSSSTIYLQVDKNDNIWVAIDSLLIKYDGDNWTTFKENLPDFPNFPNEMFRMDSLGNFILRNNYYYVKFDGTNWQVVYDLSNNSTDNPWNMEFDKNGNLYIISEYGLHLYDGKNIIDMTIGSFEIMNYASNIEISSNNDLWLGTNGYGLIRYNSSDYQVYHPSQTGLSGKYVNTVAFDKNGNAWIGTNHGLAVLLNAVTDVNEGYKIKDNNFLSISPNPVKENAKISFENANPGKIQISIYNILGELIRIICDKEFEHGNHTVDYNTHNLPCGNYLITMKSTDGIKTAMIIIIK